MFSSSHKVCPRCIYTYTQYVLFTNTTLNDTLFIFPDIALSWFRSIRLDKNEHVHYTKSVFPNRDAQGWYQPSSLKRMNMVGELVQAGHGTINEYYPWPSQQSTNQSMVGMAPIICMFYHLLILSCRIIFWYNLCWAIFWDKRNQHMFFFSQKEATFPLVKKHYFRNTIQGGLYVNTSEL